MQVRWGKSCPDGFLAAFSVDTKEEAEELVKRVCVKLHGEFYSTEVLSVMDMDGNIETNARIDAFNDFRDNLEKEYERKEEWKLTKV